MADIIGKKESRKWRKQKVIEIWIIMDKTEIKSIESNHKFIHRHNAYNANTRRTHHWFYFKQVHCFLYKLNTIALKVIGDTEVEAFLDKGFLTGAWLFKLCDLSFWY